jgi:peptide chain release factor 2
MAAPSFWEDNRRAQELIRERTELSRTVARTTELLTQASDLSVLLELAAEAGDDGSLDAEIAAGVARLKTELEEFELKIMLSAPHDSKAAILSIHPGAGGTESQDWAQMLMRMYLRWCERAGFKAEVVDLLPGEEAGIKSATIEVTGEYAYGYLKGEAGVHRLVRISPFDASKRRHTSFAQVDVAPLVEGDVDVDIDESEIRVDTYRASGAGGQHVNKTDSAVRITHIPTGVVVQCQNERSQAQNKAVAMQLLRSKLIELEERKRAEELAKERGEVKDVAWGSQIRSYFLHPDQRVKDHRTGHESGDTQRVLDGDIDDFVRDFLNKTAASPG